MSLVAVFLASLLGSPHCAGMCGGFVALYSAESDSPIRSHFAYHFGRLVVYSLVGAIAGALGHTIDDLGAVTGVQRVSTIITGVLLLYWGVRGLAGHGPLVAGAESSHSSWFQWVLSSYRRVIGGEGPANWVLRSLAIGMLSALLPCGWLYTFAAVAAASGSALHGTAVMAVFWIGTIPMLATVGTATRLLDARLRPLVPRLVGGLLIAAGLFSLLSHQSMSVGHHHDHGSHLHLMSK